jgi:very-short-patch-repair endonuclease
VRRAGGTTVVHSRDPAISRRVAPTGEGVRMHPSPQALALFSTHGGCAAVRHLVALPGVDHLQIHRWNRQGVILPMHRDVHRLAGAPETDEQALWAAILRGGDHALAGPRATCWLLGLEGFTTLEVDVVVKAPHRCRATSFPCTTRVLAGGDRAETRGYPCLSVTRAVIEVARALAPKDLRTLIDSARRNGLLEVDRLARRARALEEAPGSRRGAVAVLAVIASGTLAQESETERDAEPFLATTTLELVWQVTDLVPGRRFDAVDHAARIIVEVDSRAWHTLGSDRDADGLRDLQTEEVAGYLVIRLTAGMIRHHGDEVRRRIDAIRAKRVAEHATG